MEYKRKEEDLIRKDEKRSTLAKFITMKVKQGEDITELMGKPMNYWDYNKIYRELEEWEGKQQKLPLTEEQQKRKEEIDKKLGKEIDQSYNEVDLKNDTVTRKKG